MNNPKNQQGSGNIQSRRDVEGQKNIARKFVEALSSDDTDKIDEYQTPGNIGTSSTGMLSQHPLKGKKVKITNFFTTKDGELLCLVEGGGEDSILSLIFEDNNKVAEWELCPIA